MTLIDKRTQKPFRVFHASPSWLSKDQQIVTPREWRPTQQVGNWAAFWALTGIVLAFVAAILFVRAAFSIR